MYEMPDKVYTTGDEVRLSVEIITEENPTFVTAVFRAEDNVRQTFTMHDDLVLDEPPEVFPPSVPTKTCRAKLVSLLDVDNPPGVYRLDSIMYGDPAVGTIAYETSFGEEAPVFYVYKRRIVPEPTYSPGCLEGLVVLCRSCHQRHHGMRREVA